MDLGGIAETGAVSISNVPAIVGEYAVGSEAGEGNVSQVCHFDGGSAGECVYDGTAEGRPRRYVVGLIQ